MFAHRGRPRGAPGAPPSCGSPPPSSYNRPPSRAPPQRHIPRSLELRSPDFGSLGSKWVSQRNFGDEFDLQNCLRTAPRVPGGWGSARRMSKLVTTTHFWRLKIHHCSAFAHAHSSAGRGLLGVTQRKDLQPWMHSRQGAWRRCRQCRSVLPWSLLLPPPQAHDFGNAVGGGCVPPPPGGAGSSGSTP